MTMREINSTRIIIYIIILSLFIFQSCCNPDPINFNVTSVDNEIKRIIGSEINGSLEIESFIVEQYVPDNTGITYDSVGILIIPRMEVTSNYNFSIEEFFIQKSYACKPNKNHDYLSDISITSTENYNESYPKGSDLKDVFIANRPYMAGEKEFSYFFNERVDQIFIRPRIAPDSSKLHKFSINLKLTDQRTYQTTFEIRILK